jgi:tol-pal system beta propeller repeat protein TolB
MPTSKTSLLKINSKAIERVRSAILIIALLAPLAPLSGCATAPASTAADYGSGSQESTPTNSANGGQITSVPSPTPEIVATLSKEVALELAELGQIAFTASVGGRRDIWLINPDGEDEYNLTGEMDNVFAEAPVWAPDGQSIAYDGLVGDAETRDIMLVTLAGPQIFQLTVLPDYDCYPSFSPDGEKIVYMSERDDNRDLYIMDRNGNDLARLTDDLSNDYEPAWSPNGEQIAFVSRRTGHSQIYVMDDQGRNARALTDSDSLDWRPSWSPDGEWIAFESWRNGSGDIFIMRKDGSDLQQLTTSPSEDGHPDFSPDGRYLIFHSRRTGDYQLFVMELENPENVWHLPTTSVRSLLPTWSPLATK